MMWGIGYSMLGWGWLTGAFAIVLLIVAAAIGVRLLSGRPFPPASRDRRGTDSVKTPRQILDERYARGDLSTKEYREHLQNLSPSRG